LFSAPDTLVMNAEVPEGARRAQHRFGVVQSAVRQGAGA
jgi:hypothetical protein